MFQSIRNFFRDLFFGKDELPDVIWNKEYRLHVVHEDEALTSAELQMLQRIVAYYIRIFEEGRSEGKEDALKFPVGSDERNILFSDYRKAKEKSKKLSALQYRLKHKIAARG